jgi:hypothetical protein
MISSGHTEEASNSTAALNTAAQGYGNGRFTASKTEKCSTDPPLMDRFAVVGNQNRLPIHVRSGAYVSTSGCGQCDTEKG